MTQGEEGNQGKKDTRRDEMINNYSQNVHRIFDSLKDKNGEVIKRSQIYM